MTQYTSGEASGLENAHPNSHEVTKCVQDLNCTGMEKAAAAVLHEILLDHPAKKLTTDV